MIHKPAAPVHAPCTGLQPGLHAHTAHTLQPVHRPWRAHLQQQNPVAGCAAAHRDLLLINLKGTPLVHVCRDSCSCLGVYLQDCLGTPGKNQLQHPHGCTLTYATPDPITAQDHPHIQWALLVAATRTTRLHALGPAASGRGAVREGASCQLATPATGAACCCVRLLGLDAVPMHHQMVH